MALREKGLGKHLKLSKGLYDPHDVYLVIEFSLCLIEKIVSLVCNLLPVVIVPKSSQAYAFQNEFANVPDCIDEPLPVNNGLGNVLIMRVLKDLQIFEIHCFLSLLIFKFLYNLNVLYL